MAAKPCHWHWLLLTTLPQRGMASSRQHIACCWAQERAKKRSLVRYAKEASQKQHGCTRISSSGHSQRLTKQPGTMHILPLHCHWTEQQWGHSNNVAFFCSDQVNYEHTRQWGTMKRGGYCIRLLTHTRTHTHILSSTETFLLTLTAVRCSTQRLHSNDWCLHSKESVLLLCIIPHRRGTNRPQRNKA